MKKLFFIVFFNITIFMYSQTANEIIGSFDYTDFGQAEITSVEDNKISGMVNGQFYNPYRDELQIALLIFENIEIGMDPEGTFYTGDD